MASGSGPALLEPFDRRAVLTDRRFERLDPVECTRLLTHSSDDGSVVVSGSHFD